MGLMTITSHIIISISQAIADSKKNQETFFTENSISRKKGLIHFSLTTLSFKVMNRLVVQFVFYFRTKMM